MTLIAATTMTATAGTDRRVVKKMIMTLPLESMDPMYVAHYLANNAARVFWTDDKTLYLPKQIVNTRLVCKSAARAYSAIVERFPGYKVVAV